MFFKKYTVTHAKSASAKFISNHSKVGAYWNMGAYYKMCACFLKSIYWGALIRTNDMIRENNFLFIIFFYFFYFFN